ncbi:MAG: hypothetical protein ACHQXK_05700 [Methanosarcina thermophila]|nr:hypothetical protein [Methanosarcina thermophila]NLU56879.1 hypothetical protein [Methanosarcina thermophila]HOA68227.1 hypothetical protein [Methanosarcina thermophila]HOQ65064.1 hypothetical protein [Methanosarcina thermophila]HPT80356.1 hypothetical protein [Methanosarcina thermophila]HPZ18996.1 hypothetical protein [Methanosarcina thermophila]
MQHEFLLARIPFRPNPVSEGQPELRLRRIVLTSKFEDALKASPKF